MKDLLFSTEATHDAAPLDADDLLTLVSVVVQATDGTPVLSGPSGVMLLHLVPMSCGSHPMTPPPGEAP